MRKAPKVLAPRQPRSMYHRIVRKVMGGRYCCDQCGNVYVYNPKWGEYMCDRRCNYEW